MSVMEPMTNDPQPWVTQRAEVTGDGYGPSGYPVTMERHPAHVPGARWSPRPEFDTQPPVRRDRASIGGPWTCNAPPTTEQEESK